jgi:hypothetical protein
VHREVCPDIDFIVQIGAVCAPRRYTPQDLENELVAARIAALESANPKLKAILIRRPP